MKKTIISMAAAALCASALSTQAFAADILSDKSVYAKNSEELARAAGTAEFDGKTISADPNTIMPYYYVNFLDYARTGNFDIIPFAKGIGQDDGEIFVADALDTNGKFAGTVQIITDDSSSYIGVFEPRSEKKDSLAFEPNARRINAVLEKHKINLDCKEIKFVLVTGIGNFYYIDTGTAKYLAASNFGGVNGEIFNEGNGGLIEINDEFKAFADSKLAEYEEYKREVLDKLAPGENPPSMGGTDTPEYIVDNTPYLNDTDAPSTPDNPITGSNAAALAAELGLASAMIIGGMIVRRKRKN